MAASKSSRRDFVVTSGATAAMLLGVSPDALRRAFADMNAARAGQDVTLEHLSLDQAADLEAIAEQIIPTDDLPGAREARVIVFMDRTFGGLSAEGRRSFLDDLAALNAKAAERAGRDARFADLTSEEQTALIRDVEADPFFEQVRANTLIGMFAHPNWGGNYDGAGWKVLGFEPRFIWQPPFGAYDAEVHR